MTIFQNVIHAGFLMHNKYDQIIYMPPKWQCFTHQVPCLALSAPQILKKHRKTFFVHDHQKKQQILYFLVSNNSGVFDAFVWSVLEVRSYDLMQACSIFSQQHNLGTLTWGMSTQTHASNIGCSKHRSGAYYWGSHYSNREQRNKHRWDSLIGQALSDIICDRRSAVDAWVQSCPSLSIFKHNDSNQTCLGSI